MTKATGMSIKHAWQTPKAGKDGGWVLLDLGIPAGMKFTPETTAKLSALDVSFVELKDGSFSGYAFKSNRDFMAVPSVSPKDQLNAILKGATLVARKGYGASDAVAETPARKDLV